ncbi:DUF6493 family protein [Streptomyces sp. Q6]|uniref:DUF6493 family protein n=1 Tax=Streptomyces citrinus TaxID=3118173 RepID=A0ACD5A6Q3_9ACTN
MSHETLLRWVRKGDLDEVADLLDGMTDVERRACLPALKEFRKELRAEPWSSDARVAYPALQAAGAACHTGAAAAATWLGAADWRWSRQAAPQVLLHLLGDRETAWLADVAHRLAALPTSRGVPYGVLSGLVALSGCPVPTTEAYVVGWVDHVNTGRGHRQSLADRLRAEPHLAELTAALFETDDIGGRLDWYEPNDRWSWSRGLAELAAEGVLERKALVDGCVARLVRGGRPSDVRLFLKVLDRLALSRDEQRERLADWVALCADGAAPVATYAQKVLGALALDGEVSARSLAEVSVAVLFRPEKKLVRAQLVLLDRVLRSIGRQGGPAADELLPAAGEAFGHADTEVQERALKLVARHIADAGAAARSQLALAADQLSAGLRSRAEEVLGVRLSADGPYEEVLPTAAEPFRLASAPDSAAEVAEEVGALLASGGDMAAFERTLDGLMRHAYRDRAALKEALLPAVSRRWWYDSDRQGFAQTHFRGATYGLEVVAAAVADTVRTGVLHEAVTHGPQGRASHADSALRRCYDARLWEAAYQIRTAPVPFLLATPTWSTGFIEPAALVQRLAAYRDAGARVGSADFAQALLRVDRGSAQAEDAARDAAALGTREGGRLADWLRSPTPVEAAMTLGADSGHLLVGLGEQADLHDGLPDPFRRLGKSLPLPEESVSYWQVESGTPQEQAHWLAVLPGRRETVAARLLQEVSFCTVYEIRGAAAYLPLLAEAEGTAGTAVHLSVAYGLAARHPEDRLAAVDALLILAGRRQLDGRLLGSLLAQAWDLADVKATRLAESLGTAAATGAFGTVSQVLRGLVPTLLARKESPVALRGLGDLLGVAADCAERTGEREAIPGLADVAARKGSSRLVAQARRLHAATG